LFVCEPHQARKKAQEKKNVSAVVEKKSAVEHVQDS
jgi:hypothetical protein